MSRFCFCNCPAGFSAEPERHAPDCPGRSGAGKARTPVPATTPALTVNAAEELDAVLHWRGKHTQAIRERDALQQRLTAADERTDVLETALKKISIRCEAYIEAEREMPEPSVEVCQMIASAALKPAEPHDPCACIGCEASKASGSPFCAAHQSAKSRTRAQNPITAEGLEWMMQSDGVQQ